MTLINYKIRFFGASAFFITTLALTSMADANESIPDEALDCLIEPWVVSDVGSPSQGVISKLLVDRGDFVKRDQPLAQLESGVESSEVALAKLSAATHSEIAARKAELKLAELELTRMTDLHRQDMVSEQKRDESKVRHLIASAALAQANESVLRQQLELQRSKRLYAQRIVTSPTDGVVVAQLAFPGEFVYDAPVMTIATLDPLRVEVMLPSRLFGTIAVGDRAKVYPELSDDVALFSTVDVVDAMLDSRSGTFGVRLKMSNPKASIPAGQRCRITFGPKLAAAKPGKRSAPVESTQQ